VTTGLVYSRRRRKPSSPLSFKKKMISPQTALCFLVFFFLFALFNPSLADSPQDWVEVIDPGGISKGAASSQQIHPFNPQHSPAKEKFALHASSFAHYFAEFNADDEDLYSSNQLIQNSQAWAALKNNIPLLDCPDATLERTYYFRWWTYRKHIKRAKIIRAPPANSKFNSNSSNFLFPVDEAGRVYTVITEFLPTVSWSGLANTISCAAAHHFREGRWLHTTAYLESYAKFWFVNDAGGEGGGNPRQYSFWAADSIRSFAEVTGDPFLSQALLPLLIKNFETLRRTNFYVGSSMKNDTSPVRGLYFNTDNRDGMEASIGGGRFGNMRCFRPTLNSYMFGEAMAISKIAAEKGDQVLAAKYRSYAAMIKKNVEELLWDKSATFFKVRPVGTEQNTAWEKKTEYSSAQPLVDVRELHGYTPWYFGLPSSSKAVAWKHLTNSSGFAAPKGLTTAEQSHPKFKLEYAHTHECQWNGPAWPYATSVTLTALANYLSSPSAQEQTFVSDKDYCKILMDYAAQHRRMREDNSKTVSWIDENYHPFTGDWISRTLLKTWEKGSWSEKKGGKERGKDYNHSTFIDLIISGLIGLKPSMDNFIEVNPLVSSLNWEYFCLDRILYHSRYLTIMWDSTGARYQRGAGFKVFVDGKLVASSPTIKRIKVSMAP